jgi:hypothetical protein
MALAAALLLAPAAARAQTAAPDSVRAGSARADSLRVDSVDVRVGPVVVDSAAQARLRAYTGDLADPLVAAQALALGLYDHARTQPEEWGGGADALGKRVLSRAGGHVVTQSVRHGMAAVLNRSTEYRVCGCAEPERRAAHALFETFTDYDAQGRARVSTPFLAGTYAGALAPLLWHPDADAARALQSGTLALVFAVAGNVVRELLEP